MHYIYKITNILNNKVYIGQTNDPKYRWYQHQSYSKGEKPQQYIHRAIAKYSVENFTFEVIDVGLNQWHIDCLETNYIQTFDSRNKEYGYNLAPGGGGVGSGANHPLYGKKQSQETINKRIEKLRGQKRTPEQLQHLSQARKDHPVIYTDEIRLRMSEAHLGNIDSEETKQRKADSASVAWETRADYTDVKCQAPGCQISGKAKYKFIDGIRYCNKHGLRMLRNGTLEKLPVFKYTDDNPMPEEVRKKCGNGSRGKPAYNRIIFTDEQISMILSDNRSNKKIAKDLKVTEKVIKRIKAGNH